MSGVPRTVTCRMIVCQLTPSVAATGATARSWWPTCSNPHCLARSVRTAREAIAGWSSVQVLLGHNTYRHSKMRFRHRITTGTPLAGRSRTVTVRRSFTLATAPQSPHPTRSLGVSIPTCHSPSTISVERTSNPGMPNRAVTFWVTWGSSHRGHLAVNTDREGPRPHLSATQPRRVAQGSTPTPSINAKSRIEEARARATPMLVNVLRRYPPAPPGRTRVAQLMTRLDSSLRQE
jgi:hypothetical protein